MSKEEKFVEENKEVKPFYNYRHRPPKVTKVIAGVSKVQESPLDARSPQELMDKYGMYKDSSALKEPSPFYADLTQFEDYASSLNHIRDIKEKFNQLDIDIKAKFNHNPEEFCNYIMSKDFDIKNIMSEKMYETYSRRKEEEKRQKEYDEYLKSDEYKKIQEETAKRMAYEQARYEEWKKSQGGSK